jgi:hypothetical protein
MSLEDAKKQAAALRRPLSSVKDAPVVVHHYTTPAFMSIVESRSLWCSNIAYSNDPEESRYAHNLIANAIKENLEPSTCEFVQLMLPHFSYYGVSFSGERDLLQQWRAYCDNGQGMAVGVRTLTLLTHQEFMFGRVEYDHVAQKGLVADMVKLFAPYFQGASGSPQFHAAATALGMNLAVLNGMFKSSAYSVEQEYRLFKISTIGQDSTDENVKFRVSQNNIIPYRLMRFDDALAHDRVSALANVVVGPCLEYDTFEPAVRVLLARSSWPGVTIERSGVRMRRM